MRTVLMALVCVVSVGVVLTGCSAHPDKDALYPTASGLRWKYRVVTKRKGEPARKTIRIMENVDRQYFAGEDNVLIRRNNFGTRYYVARRDDGFYRVATKSPVSHTPIMDQPAMRILPLPARKGSQWREQAHTYMLKRARTFIAKQMPEDNLVLDFRITRTNASVDVPAGHFEKCVLAVGKTTFHLGADAGVAPSDVPIVQREWYCPGVGLTRLSRDEKLTSGQDVIIGGHMEIALLGRPG